jgi:hypothetical protein
MTQEHKQQISRDYSDIERMIDDLYCIAKNKDAANENEVNAILLLRRKVFDQKVLLLR